MRSIYFITLKKKTIVRSIILLSFVILALCSIGVLASTIRKPTLSPVWDNINVQSNPSTPAKLAIVIDDFGSSRDGVDEMMSIERPLTFAVMPFLDYSQTDAQKAHDRGHEIIIHLPMESVHGKKSWLGSRPVMTDMESSEVMEIVMDSIKSVPYAKGLNNHMGSKATSNEKILASIMDVLSEKDLYFLDSLTTTSPVGKKIAQQKGILYYERDVFLDGQKPKSYIKDQLEKAGEIALKRGYALAIGHVGIEGGKVTAEAINEMLPEFDKRNIQLVFVSQLPSNQ
ncbi:UNVERIFIED_CONTAM: hypothetical protein Cloal_2789 [Acetivibrio alkalicellulosi]